MIIFKGKKKKISDTPSWNDTWEDKLKQNLLAKYDKFARPAQHHNTTTVNVSLNIFAVNVVTFNFNIKSSRLASKITSINIYSIVFLYQDDKTNVMAVNVWNMMVRKIIFLI